MASRRTWGIRGMTGYVILSVAILAIGCTPEKKRGIETTLAGGAATNSGLIGPADCNDKVDNDGDGLVDFEQDPGCDSANDPSEVDPQRPACNDDQDNDGDGLVDFGQDPGCSDFQDDDEEDGVKRACEDGIDNDGDGDIDTQDDGCSDPKDNDESDDPPPPACRDGVDNDGDGDIDFPADRGCGSPDGLDEAGEGQLVAQPQCADGRDNDGDGLVDLYDPGCSSAGAPRENDPANLPQCSNGIDDNNNGIVDFPFDPGCQSAGDNEELDEEVTPRCSNGMDDDQDGFIDFPNDPGCVGPGDKDETDPPVLSQCADMVDNDQDGVRDYPDDLGCSSRGDPVESALCGPRREARKLSDGQVIRGHAQEGTFEYEGSCGGRGGAENVYFYRLNRRVEALEISTRFDDTELETVIYVRRRCTEDGSEIACKRESLDDGVAGNDLRLDEPQRGEYYIFIDGVGAAQKTFTLQVSEIPIAQCRNEIDDDDDGKVDYPSDPGCETPEDRDELDPDTAPICSDGLDNDEDGLTDFPFDIGCRAASGRDEVDACGQGVVMEDFPFNHTSVDGTTALEQGDDCAADNPCQPGMDGQVRICVSGVCRSSCTNNMDCVQDAGENCVNGSCVTGNRFTGSCGGQNLPEKVYVYNNAVNANLTFKVVAKDPNPEMPNPIGLPKFVLYARADCDNGQTEVGCSQELEAQEPDDDDPPQPIPPGEPQDDEAPVEQEAVKVVIDQVPPGLVYVFVDTVAGLGGPFRLSVDVERLPPGCSDQRDNDEDGFVDADDLGCSDADDEDESDELDQKPVCSDGIDNDQDGRVDYPLDPGCVYRGGGSEDDPPQQPQCSDGLDNDEDDWVDFPDDPGCSSAGDNDEGDIDRPQCRNSIDDDMDGLVDYPLDPGCAGRGDLSEVDGEIPPPCSDDKDNDRDGLVDYPFDPGCRSAGGMSETNPAIPRVCSNGVDDDGDMLIDFPADPGCDSASDTDEADPALVRQCADGRDNDGDGQIDWPADRGCRYAADNIEQNSGRLATQCSDGIDNDMDGDIDFADSGCVDVLDNDESDPVAGNNCYDGIDNDEDGLIDWPDDEGCSSRGAECEQSGYGLCEGVCYDLQTSTQHCGRCNRACPDDVECIDGFCGGMEIFEGIRQNVPDADLDGWEICHLDQFGDSSPVQTMLNNCNGEYVMMGCRPTNANIWTLVAMGERTEVFRDTGVRNNDLNTHNGVDWYFSDSYSMGFVAQGSGVSRNSCDTRGAPSAELRMCWHSSGGNITGGYRCGATTGLNGSQQWDRAVWTTGRP